MVNAKLHVICGNCGSNDDFEWKGNKSIICENCSTKHNLSDNMNN